MIATNIEQSTHLLELGLEPKTADMLYYPTAINEMGETMFTLDVKGEYIYQEHDDECIPAWSLSALLEVMPRPDLYRETADLWVCVTFFKEGSIRGFGETDIDAAYEAVCTMFERRLMIKKGGEE